MDANEQFFMLKCFFFCFLTVESKNIYKYIIIHDISIHKCIIIHHMAVAIKYALIVFITFTKASSQCLYCNAEQYFEHFLEEKNNLYLTTSVWNICRGNCARLPPKSLLQILLTLAGDVELCPDPRARCSECTKCFPRNTDKTLCSVCSKVFH